MPCIAYCHIAYYHLNCHMPCLRAIFKLSFKNRAYFKSYFHLYTYQPSGCSPVRAAVIICLGVSPDVAYANTPGIVVLIHCPLQCSRLHCLTWLRTSPYSVYAIIQKSLFTSSLVSPEYVPCVFLISCSPSISSTMEFHTISIFLCLTPHPV